ncbi:MAG: hypothetical protein NVS3B18_14440 [Candidatus Dormibacteria bacterium]
MVRGLAAVAAGFLVLAPLLTLSGCGSGTGQLQVSLSGDAQNYAAGKPASYSHYKPGDEATFSVNVVNTGPGSVTGVTLHVNLPASFRYHATTSIDASGATRTQPLDAAVNSPTPIFGVWTLAPPGSAGNTSVAVTFTANVSGKPGGATVQAFAAGDTNAGQTSATAYNVIVDPAAKVTALVTASPTSIKRGGTVTYEVRVSNSGTGNANDVGVLITLPPVMTFAGTVTPFAGNGSRSKGVDPIKNTLEVFYDGFILPPLSNAGPGFVVIKFKATVLGAGSGTGSQSPTASATAGAPPAAPTDSALPSSAPSTVPPGTYTVDTNITDTAGDTFSLHSVAAVIVSA